MVVYYYDVLDKNGYMIHECLTGQEIIEIFHLSENARISQYVRRGSMLKDKYRIVINKSGIRKRESPSKDLLKCFTEKTLNEWRFMNKKYGKKVVVSKMETV